MIENETTCKLDVRLIRYYDEDVIINIDEPSEKTPLIGGKLKSSELPEITPNLTLKLVGITIFLLSGISVAIYLLIVETRHPVIGFGLDLVNRDVWSLSGNIPMGDTLNHTNVLHVIVTQTGGRKCIETEMCMNLLRSMQDELKRNENSEIPYNFMIGGNGQTYEIRGWRHENGFHFIPKQSSLVIGFIGDYTIDGPTDNQLDGALSLISESIKIRRLQKNFKIYGVQNLTISHSDGEALFQKISQWKNFDTLLKIL